MTPFSAVVITKDEAHDLPACLDSLAGSGCAEIVVVDSGSTDGTIEYLRGRDDVRLVHRDFDGYGPQKRFAVAQADHDWILSLDADEVLTHELAVEIHALAERDFEGPAGYEIRRNLVFLGRQLRHGRESGLPVLRLFDRRRGNFDDAKVHEKVLIEGRPGRLAGLLLHYSYRNLDEYFEKFNEYSRLGAETMVARGRVPGQLAVLAKLKFTFLQSYLLHGNWRNGFAGLVWSWLRANYHAVRFLKAWEAARGLRR
jgi:glycosyltransferase involved in cell wall biosynthesis